MSNYIFLTVMLIAFAVLFHPHPAPAQDRDALFAAICMVESSNNPNAHNRGEDARGIIQVRAIMVRDVNRILGRDHYTHNDAYNPTKARQMWFTYCHHYYPNGTDEEWARAWNGGPRGPQREATLGCWHKVRQHL